jgi:hypothetical protein
VNDTQVPLLIFLGIVVVLLLLALWGYLNGAWELPVDAV